LFRRHVKSTRLIERLQQAWDTADERFIGCAPEQAVAKVRQIEVLTSHCKTVA
jgi:hypothetical protein